MEAINSSSYNLPKNYSSLPHIFVIITSYFRHRYLILVVTIYQRITHYLRHHYLIFSSSLPHICSLRIGTRDVIKTLHYIPRPSYILLTSGTFTGMAIQLVVRRSGQLFRFKTRSSLLIAVRLYLKQPCHSLNSKREIPSLQ